MIFKSNAVKLLFTVLIGTTCLTGDSLTENVGHPVIRAVIDNATHAIIAGLSWTLLTLLLNESTLMKNFTEIISCALISSFIDLDHFVQARSWRLSDATRLSKRAFFHSTTVPLMLWLFMLLVGKVLNNEKMEYYSWIILMSFLSHHIRDATRRGLWFAPIINTRPIPYYIYITITMLLPYAFYYVMTRRVFLRKLPGYTVYQRETINAV